MDKKQPIIFMDLEANAEKNKNRSKAELLQLSAIKVLNGKIVEEFNEYCFNRKIYKRISNLLKKDEYWFNNNLFKSTQKVYELFYEFSKGCEIYSFGNFDNLIFGIIYRKNFKKNKSIHFIKSIDFQHEVSKKMKLKNPSLKKTANILNIRVEKEHEALFDSKLLFEIFKKISSSNFNLKKYKTRKELINFYPFLTSCEFVDFRLNNKKYLLNKKYNLVCINLTQKVINEKEERINNKDVFVSNNLNQEIDEILTKKYVILKIKITIFNNDLKIIDNIEIDKKYEKENIDSKDFQEINKLEQIIKKYENDIFICETKKILNSFSTLWNRQFYFILNKFKFNKNINELKKIKNKIDLSIQEFEQ